VSSVGTSATLSLGRIFRPSAWRTEPSSCDDRLEGDTSPPSDHDRLLRKLASGQLPCTLWGVATTGQHRRTTGDRKPLISAHLSVWSLAENFRRML